MRLGLRSIRVHPVITFTINCAHPPPKVHRCTRTWTAPRHPSEYLTIRAGRFSGPRGGTPFLKRKRVVGGGGWYICTGLSCTGGDASAVPGDVTWRGDVAPAESSDFTEINETCSMCLYFNCRPIFRMYFLYFKSIYGPIYV